MNHWNIASAGLARQALTDWPVNSTPVFTTQGKYIAIVRRCSDQFGNLTGGVVVKVVYHHHTEYHHTPKPNVSTRRLSKDATERSKLHAIARCYTDCLVAKRLDGARDALYKRVREVLFPDPPSDLIDAYAAEHDIPTGYIDLSVEDCDKWHKFVTAHANFQIKFADETPALDAAFKKFTDMVYENNDINTNFTPIKA
jgi:hypothetical protein